MGSDSIDKETRLLDHQYQYDRNNNITRQTILTGSRTGENNNNWGQIQKNMASMKELVELGKKQGYLEYPVLIKILDKEVGLMPDQIEDIVDMLENLGINVIKKPEL